MRRGRMLKKLMLLLLPVTMCYADSTSVKPVNIKPSSKLILQSGTLQFDYHDGLRYPVKDLTAACPSHLTPEVAITITKINSPPPPLPQCVAIGECTIQDIKINMFV